MVVTYPVPLNLVTISLLNLTDFLMNAQFQKSSQILTVKFEREGAQSQHIDNTNVRAVFPSGL